MRLLRVMNESMLEKDVLEQKCGPYINDLMKVKRLQTLMLSGRQEKAPWFIRNVRQDRRPRDSDIKIHEMMDDVFFEKFGWRARSNSIFTSGSWDLASTYGTVYSIWPVGNYKFLYSPKVKDLYMGLQKPSVWAPSGWIEEIMLLFAKDDYYMSDEYTKDKIRKLVNTYKSDNIYKAIMSGSEIMVNCTQYIAIHNKFTSQLIEWISNKR